MGFVAVGVSEAAGDGRIDQPGVVLPRRIHLVAFPAAEGDGANPQSGSSFRLVDFELEPTLAKVAADSGRLLWNWDSAVARG